METKEGGHHSDQNSYHITAFLFKEKGRVASSHKKLYNEQRRVFYFHIIFDYDFLITHL